MATKKRKTNTEFVQELMTNGSPTGALVQPFVITAIEKYAQQVIAAGPEKFESAFMSGQAWVETAEHVKKQLALQYGE